MTATVDAADVERAAAAIEGHVVRTPLLPAPRLSELLGCELRLKLENLQVTGSFKDRGACNKLQQIRRDLPDARGVVAASAGNHAQGVAWHARALGLRATIVMPVGTPFSKVERTEALGAAVVLHGESVAEAQDHARELEQRDGLVFVHPYDDPAIVAGQGTAAIELLADWPEVDCLVAPIGGGGLLAGMAVWARARRPDLRILGVQSAACPSMHAVLHGMPPPTHAGLSLADGIAVKRPGAITRALIERCVDRVTLVDETSIEQAVQVLAAQQKVVAEGAGAAAFAAVLADPGAFAGTRTAVVVSGGNIDRRMLSTVLLRGLARDGKVARLRIEIRDVPGVLSSVTRLIGDTGADIIDITHQRTFSRLPPRFAELDVIVETRGRDHVEAILTALRQQGFQASVV
ncbi:MAG: threonine ammonia-lyase [Planctomycetota bacterium]